MHEEVSERRKCHCLGDVFSSRSWVSYTDTRQSEYKYLSEPASEHAVPSLQASPNQPAIFMQDDTRHAAKQAKQFLEAKNIEIMKWPGQSPDLNSTENASEKWRPSYG